MGPQPWGVEVKTTLSSKASKAPVVTPGQASHPAHSPLPISANLILIDSSLWLSCSFSPLCPLFPTLAGVFLPLGRAKPTDCFSIRLFLICML